MPGRNKPVKSRFYVASECFDDAEEACHETSTPVARPTSGRNNSATPRSTFYVSSEVNSIIGEIPMKPVDLPSLEPDLLDGEIIASKAEGVLRLHVYSKTRGESGNLYCTNFRICFVTSNDPTLAGIEGNNHRFLGSDDVILSNISTIYQISKDNKTKKLSPSKNTGAHCRSIQIHTKDLGIHHFSFEFTHKKERNTFVTAILHHAFPNRHDLLFAYEFSRTNHRNSTNGASCSKSETSSVSSVSENAHIEQWRPGSYSNRQDWEKELIRLGAKGGWRVPHVNEQFNVSPTMPEFFAAPKEAQDLLLSKAASQFTNNRLPIWCYTHSNGYSLVSMANLTPETIHINVEKELIEVITESQPKQEDGSFAKVVDVDLVKEIPSTISDIQTAYNKMFSICVPVTVSDFYDSDNSVYGQLDSSHWLRIVGHCLRTSKDIARKIRKGSCSVNIREDSAVDLSCVVSSLVQIMLDPTARTIKGLQNIIQRCWVVAGHPFCDRLAMLSCRGDKVSPVFLLFLDCVYQLTEQFPSAFEFSEIYLISLWDSCGTGLFREFIFNCNKERRPAKQTFTDPETSGSRNGAASDTLPSVWSWDIQYNADYISLFKNPLYELNSIQSTTSLPQHGRIPKIIKPNCHPSQIEVWVGCFYRNTAPMQITNGGKPAEYFQQCIIMEEIIELQNQLSKLKSGQAQRSSGLFFNTSQTSSAGDGGLLEKLRQSFITSTFPFNNRISRNVSDISLCTLLERSSLGVPDSVYEED